MSKPADEDIRKAREALERVDLNYSHVSTAILGVGYAVLALIGAMRTHWGE